MEKLTKYLNYLELSDDEKDNIDDTQESLFCDMLEVCELDWVKKNYNDYERLKIRNMLDTPKVLYRILYLFPEQAEEIGKSIKEDFYKNRLLLFKAYNNNILIDISIYKYEIHIYYHCKREFIIDRAGYTGDLELRKKYDDLIHNDKNSWWDATATEDIMKYIDTIDKALCDTVYMIYPGNNFEV